MVFQNESELSEFLAAFDEGRFPVAHFNHAAHVAMAAAKIWAEPDSALPRIREGILQYMTAQGITPTEDRGYHETLTVFWVRILAAFHANWSGPQRLPFVNAAVREFGRRAALTREYWSFDVLASPEARRGWIEPDLQPLL